MRTKCVLKFSVNHIFSYSFVGNIINQQNFIVMIKSILSIAILLCTTISGNVQQEPENPENPGQIVEIPIVNDKVPLRPRTPDYCGEISAYYQNGVIYLQFSEDIGCMDVEVVNLTTGELWSDDACSDSGVETIAVSSAAGSYAIALTTDNGSTYSGEYTIE